MLAVAPPGTLATSSLTLLEFVSAIARLDREGNLLDEPRVIRDMLEEHARYVYTVHEPTANDFKVARDLLMSDTKLGLRGPDALHLAIANRLGETVFTLDQKLLKSALALVMAATDAGVLEGR